MIYNIPIFPDEICGSSIYCLTSVLLFSVGILAKRWSILLNQSCSLNAYVFSCQHLFVSSTCVPMPFRTTTLVLLSAMSPGLKTYLPEGI